MAAQFLTCLIIRWCWILKTFRLAPSTKTLRSNQFRATSSSSVLTAGACSGLTDLKFELPMRVVNHHHCRSGLEKRQAVRVNYPKLCHGYAQKLISCTQSRLKLRSSIFKTLA